MKRMYKAMGSFFVAAFVAVATVGCVSVGNNGGESGGGGDSSPAVEQCEIVDPVIRPGHLIRIGVAAAGKAEVEEVPREVSAKGEILMPLVGAVKCDGLTVQQLQSRLEELFSQYIHDPQVSVSFIYSPEGGGLSPWGTVLVMGEVLRKGPVNIPPTRDLTVMKAIQMAGGTTPLAAPSKVHVTRKGRRIEVNLTTIGKHGDISKDITLQPDDVVFVPESYM